MIAVIAACVFGSLINQTSAAAAEPTQVEPPLRLTVAPAGAERLRGWLTSYDDTGFAMKTASGEVARVAWRDLPSERVMWVQEKILDRGDARGWFILAAMLYPREDGRAPGELALRRALNADPGLASKAERLRDGEPVDIDEPEPETPSSPEDGHRHADGNAGGQGEGGPVAIGELESQFWGELSEELMAQSVEDIKARMAEAQRVLNQRLPLYEEASDYFLFYSDLPPREAKQWAGLLDKMYDRLCKIFDLEQGKNIFRGRGLIIVFRHELDYHRYQAMVHGMLGSEGTAGLCRSFGDGHVEVTFFKQNNDLDFARVLVHEAVHAFVHRYRSYPFVDSWINEGLAEYVSSALVDNSGFGDTSWSRSLEFGKQSLRDRKSFGGNSFFYASHIDGWQYPLAHMLTAFMIQQDGQRYRAFINAIKDGKKWDVAMEEDYGVELETLVEAFGRSLKIRDLKP
ncbi:MAG: hypothetical protein AAF086_02385 [Planctomycetota bacterium]